MTAITRASIDKTLLLTDDMLARFDERAPVYDRENRFFEEDFAELRDSGYLLAAVPTEYGGAGLRLGEVMQLQQRLAYHAPATAIAINMHLYWTGVAADLLRCGDPGCMWILEDIAAKHFAVNQAWNVVDRAFDVTGGGGVFRRNRLEQLFRDARLGRIHPVNSIGTHETIGKAALGIDLDELPRWG